MKTVKYVTIEGHQVYTKYEERLAKRLKNIFNNPDFHFAWYTILKNKKQSNFRGALYLLMQNKCLTYTRE